MKLEKAVESVISLHKYEIKPKKSTIVLEQQLGLFDLRNYSQKDLFKQKNKQLGLFGNENGDHTRKAQLMGDFYESIIAGFNGGKIMKGYLPVSSNSPDLIEYPDVLDKRNGKAYESKSCVAGSHCIISSPQLENHLRLIEEPYFFKFEYVIFRHTIRRLKSDWTGTRDDLIEGLCNNTSYALVLPINLILELSGVKMVNSDLVYIHTNGNTFEPSTMIKSSTLLRFLTEPEKVLDDLRLKKDSYKIERLLSPKNFKVEDYLLKQFPIVRFEENYDLSDVPF